MVMCFKRLFRSSAICNFHSSPAVQNYSPGQLFGLLFFSRFFLEVSRIFWKSFLFQVWILWTFFGIYVWLIPIISEYKKQDKFGEVKILKHPNNILLLPHHHPNLLFEIWLDYIPNHKSKFVCLQDIT